MALESVEAGRLGLLDELRLELLVRHPEGHVHARAALLGRVAAVVPAAAVDRVVELLRLADVGLLDRLQAAQADQPLHRQADHVDGEDGGRVVQRLVLDVDPVLQHDRQERVRGVRGRPLHQVVADDHQGDPRRPEVLLDAGVHDAVLRHVERAAEHVRRGVGHHRGGAEVRQLVELDTVNGLVRRHVHVRGARRELELLLPGHADVVLRLVVEGHVDGADLLRLLHRLVRPRPGHDVVGRRAGVQQVHRHHRELGGRATGKEQDVVVVGDARQLADVRFTLGEDGLERLRPMADLEHRHADAGERQQVALRFLECGERQHGRAGREVVDAVH